MTTEKIKQSFDVKEPFRLGVLLFLAVVFYVVIIFIFSLFTNFNDKNNYLILEDEDRKDVSERAAVEGVKNEKNGLVVLPSSGDEKTDEEIKEKIRMSFSDKVKVLPDESKKSGVIIPEFKYSEGEDYIYILVPINK